jgi:uncharacterized membrane protein
MNKISKNNLALFLLIFVLSVLFYSLYIGFSDLWSDEIYTKSIINGTLQDLFARLRNDLHPPLYYLGLRLFTSVFGLSTISLRMFSVLGVLSALLIGYFSGQRVFGRHGALYFCLMLVSIPMLASYSHEARMYTWAAFSMTGVFIYAFLFMKTGKTSDLVLLFIFTLFAMYTHYYGTLAAFMANLFVFIYLLLTKNRKWISHLLSLFLALLLFLPWIPMLIIQVHKVQNAFWAPPIDLRTIYSCFTTPFTEQCWTSAYSVALIILVYGLSIFTVCRSFHKSFSEYRLVLWLSITIFLGTLALVIVISLFSQPILFSRYVMAIVVMLIVPITILLIKINNRWVKMCLIGVVFLLGIHISVSTFRFSYGPYKQTVDYIANTYPDIHKILHLTEITAGPMVEYSGNTGINNYWLKAKMSNVDAFAKVHQYYRPDEFLQPDEMFCVVQFNDLELNKENLDVVLSESEFIKTDTVCDNKDENGNKILVYILKFHGK